MKMQRTISIKSKEQSGYDFEHWLSLSVSERMKEYTVLLKNRPFDPITEEHRKLLRTSIRVVKNA